MSRELDREVAEKIFGLHYPPEHQQRDNGWQWCNWSDGRPLCAYSQLIQGAWRVVEKMGQPFYLEFSNGVWFAMFGDDLGNGVMAPAAPEAICRAALKAVDNGKA
jgi:hypothetical protein